MHGGRDKNFGNFTQGIPQSTVHLWPRLSLVAVGRQYYPCICQSNVREAANITLSTLSGDNEFFNDEVWKYVVQTVSSTIVEHRNTSGTVVEQ
jgi:hypothetical protein